MYYIYLYIIIIGTQKIHNWAILVFKNEVIVSLIFFVTWFWGKSGRTSVLRLLNIFCLETIFISCSTIHQISRISLKYHKIKITWSSEWLAKQQNIYILRKRSQAPKKKPSLEWLPKPLTWGARTLILSKSPLTPSSALSVWWWWRSRGSMGSVAGCIVGSAYRSTRKSRTPVPTAGRRTHLSSKMDEVGHNSIMCWGIECKLHR